MGKSNNNGMGSEEEEKAQAPLVDIDVSSETAERKVQAGDPMLAAAPPRKRGRPRKIVPKVEESIPLELPTADADAESKKQPKKAESARNGNNEQLLTAAGVKLNINARAPLRREGSRRKSEPRRAAD